MQQSPTADLQQIRAFVALADTGSFVAAGQQLGKDAAMISRRVQALERRLRVRLAERTTRRVELTEAGRAYLARIRPLLLEIEAADREAEDVAQGEPSGHLRITLPGSFGGLWLGPIIVDFLKAYPRVTIEADATNRFVDIVGERFDLAIRLGTLPDSRLIARKIAERRRLLCASPGYIERHGLPSSPTDLASHSSLCFTGREDPYRLSFVNAVHGSSRITVSGRLASSDAQLLVDAALGDLGILHTSDWYVGNEIAAGRLVEVLPDWQLVDRGAVYAVTPAVTGMPSKTRAFLDWLAEALIAPPWSVLG